jgi:hypothetical protein
MNLMNTYAFLIPGSEETTPTSHKLRCYPVESNRTLPYRMRANHMIDSYRLHTFICDQHAQFNFSCSLDLNKSYMRYIIIFLLTTHDNYATEITFNIVEA